MKMTDTIILINHSTILIIDYLSNQSVDFNRLIVAALLSISLQ